MIETVDVLTGIVPVVLIVAFILLVVRMMTDGKTGMVDRMKQAVGGVVMLLVALLVIFAFIGGSSPDDPDPEPTESYDVHFYVATDSAGYGTVSASVLRDVAAGTSVTVGQTIFVGGAGQCTATPSASTDQYEYAFAGWTGADDADTPAPTSIAADTAYYAHFTRTETGPTPMDPSLFTYTVENGEATVTGWAGTPPADGYDLYFPDTDGQGHPLTAIGGSSSSSYVSVFAGAKSLRADSVKTLETRALREAVLESVSLPAATSLGQSVFGNCSSLASVSLPAATSIGTYAFAGCSSLASISLPAATSISFFAFSGCFSLASVSLPAATSIENNAFNQCTGIASVTFGPLATLDNSFPQWTFYDTDGTTVLDKTAANLANSTFEGVPNALVKVPAGQQSLTREMEQRVLELSAENSLKASMLAELDPELADMDPSDVARMTVSEIESMTADDVRAIKSSLPSRSG